MTNNVCFFFNPARSTKPSRLVGKVQRRLDSVFERGCVHMCMCVRRCKGCWLFMSLHSITVPMHIHMYMYVYTFIQAEGFKTYYSQYCNNYPKCVTLPLVTVASFLYYYAFVMSVHTNVWEFIGGPIVSPDSSIQVLTRLSQDTSISRFLKVSSYVIISVPCKFRCLCIMAMVSLFLSDMPAET